METRCPDCGEVMLINAGDWGNRPIVTVVTECPNCKLTIRRKVDESQIEGNVVIMQPLALRAVATGGTLPKSEPLLIGE